MVETAQKRKTVHDLIHTKFLKLPYTTPFESAVMLLGQRQEPVAVIVDKDEQFIGILRNDDLTQAIIHKKAKSTPIKDLIEDDHPYHIHSDTPITECARIMIERGLYWITVIDDGLILGYVSLLDIQSRFVEELKSLEDTNRDLCNQIEYQDDYLGIVSHDVRTPLSVITLCCDYLLSPANTKILTNDQISFVERISRNAENAANMVTEILDVVRLEKGYSLDYTDTDIGDFLGDCISNLQVLASEKHLEVVIDCEEDISVPMDKKRMIHVLENLVNNAVKFSPTGKKIYVTAKSEERDGETYLLLTVRDEGEGIRPEDEEKVFGKYVQLESGVAKKLGLGLGLSIARKFVSLHRGFMELEGGWKKGATFKAYIPGAQINSASKVKRHSGQTRILLVEDDASIREYFEEELQQAGYEVFTAKDGDEGIHAYFKVKPDLILSDIRMPHVDGLELLAKVRMTDKSIPFILCSGYYPGLAEDLTASQYKADYVLEKPVTTEHVIKVVGEILQQTSQAS